METKMHDKYDCVYQFKEKRQQSVSATFADTYLTILLKEATYLLKTRRAHLKESDRISTTLLLPFVAKSKGVQAITFNPTRRLFKASGVTTW